MGKIRCNPNRDVVFFRLAKHESESHFELSFGFLPERPDADITSMFCKTLLHMSWPTLRIFSSALRNFSSALRIFFVLGTQTHHL